MTANPEALPTGLESYKRTAEFTETSVPAGLLRDHSTKDGTWGVIHVEQGQLRYTVTDRRREPAERILSPGVAPGLVEPTISHHVAPIGPVRFWVEFFRPAAAPAPLCRYEELATQENRARAAAGDQESRSSTGLDRSGPV